MYLIFNIESQELCELLMSFQLVNDLYKNRNRISQKSSSELRFNHIYYFFKHKILYFSRSKFVDINEIYLTNEEQGGKIHLQFEMSESKVENPEDTKDKISIPQQKIVFCNRLSEKFFRIYDEIFELKLEKEFKFELINFTVGLHVDEKLNYSCIIGTYEIISHDKKNAILQCKATTISKDEKKEWDKFDEEFYIILSGDSLFYQIQQATLVGCKFFRRFPDAPLLAIAVKFDTEMENVYGLSKIFTKCERFYNSEENVVYTCTLALKGNYDFILKYKRTSNDKLKESLYREEYETTIKGKYRIISQKDLKTILQCRAETKTVKDKTTSVHGIFNVIIDENEVANFKDCPFEYLSDLKISLFQNFQE